MNDENIIKLNDELKDKMRLMRYFSVLTFLLVIVGLGLFVYYVNTNSKQMQSNFENIIALTNISKTVVDELGNLKGLAQAQAEYNWNNDGRIENLFQKNIRDWKVRYGLENYNWLSGMDCENRKSYVTLYPWRVYEDTLIFEINDLSGKGKTMWQHNDKEVECFEGGIALNCTQVFCNEKGETNETSA
jgi:hypothetical protein